MTFMTYMTPGGALALTPALALAATVSNSGEHGC
jgi:hypothetical protein